MGSMRILVVEDEPKIAQAVKRGLELKGFAVDAVYDGGTGLAYARDSGYDLIVLDRMLPGSIDGVGVCETIRNEGISTPIIMLTARGTIGDRVSGLNSGADDYLVKPFSVRVLLARVRAVLRRVGSGDVEREEKPVELGNLKIDSQRHEVSVENKRIDLTLAEFRILQNLAKRPGRVLTRNQLLDLALGQDHFVLNRTIDVHVSALRRKLGDAGDLVETVRGVGYRLKDAESDGERPS